MQTQNESKGSAVFDQWKAEHEDIDRYATSLSEWIAFQSEQRSQQLREMVRKLTELNERLQLHFANEKQICQHLKVSHRECPMDAEAVQRQIDRDHATISTRLKHLIDRMEDAEVELDGWKKGVHELGLIIDLIEQHDEQESESVNCLLPHTSP